MTGAEYTGDLALITNTPTFIESLQYSLEQPAGIIGLNM